MSGCPRANKAGADREQFVTAAERVYFEICQDQTGKILELEKKAIRDTGRELLLHQSFRIADALEGEGIKAYGKSKFFLVGVLSGKVIVGFVGILAGKLMKPYFE